MDLPSILVGGAITLASGSAGALATGIRAYSAEKGKNLATREDLEPLTRAVEDIRADAHARIEREKSLLEHAQLINRSQYELELEAYRDVWTHLIPVQRAAAALRNQFDFPLGPGETEESRKRERYGAFLKVANACGDVIWRHRPFYPASVFSSLSDLLRLMHTEAIQYKHQDPSRNPRYYDDAIQNMDAIVRGVEDVCEAIRTRLSVARVA